MIESIAYFSMEMGLESELPTYAGGLGILAGDTVRAAADLRLPYVAVSLVHRSGYFRQRLDDQGLQSESPAEWSPEELLEPVPVRVSVELEGHEIAVIAWRYPVRGITGGQVPVYLLDTNVPENPPRFRELTDRLYGGDERYRLGQEAILGLGGLALLRALGYEKIKDYHLNEGHSALLALGLLEEQREDGAAAIEAVRRKCVFTTHTPVPAGHDQFPIQLVRNLLGDERATRLVDLGCCLSDRLNMTFLALFFSRYVNGVAMRHGQISRDMYPEYPIASITNGVHAATWTSPPFQKLFDRHVPDWREQNLNLRYAVGIPLPEIQETHGKAKQLLLDLIEARTGRRLRADVFTLGFARRATAYKRAELLLSDVERLRQIARDRPLQILYGGKAHPRDVNGKEIIRRVYERAAELGESVPVLYLEDYDMEVAKTLCAGVDLWVNTPQQPLEASGTSGMKAALNGVPSFSVLDGWWIEGHVEGVTGWAIGDSWDGQQDESLESQILYDKLATIAEVFYDQPLVYARIMRYAISLNGAFFNAQRMLQQYADSAYRFSGPRSTP